MKELLSKKSKCTGCGVCAAVCPRHCITMKLDREGFLYPHTDEENCSSCGLCIKKCHMRKEQKENECKNVLVGVHKNKDILLNSSSGGAFSAIAELWFEQHENAAVFGAYMTEDFSVLHDFCRKYEQMAKFRKSKYIFGNSSSSYSQVKNLLDDGVWVLYTGTPCQIAALKSFLGKDRENLMCVEIFCHGAGSNELFKRYINESKNKITSYSFREKSGNNPRDVKIVYADGKTEIKHKENDLYMSAYAEALFYRPSCYECKYANSRRAADISLGDCWKIKDLYDDFDDFGGVSTILFNSVRGKAFADPIQTKMYCRDADYEFIRKNTDTMRSPTFKNAKREKFYRLSGRHTVSYSIEKCLIRNDKFRKLAACLLNDKIKEQIKHLLKRI